MSERSTPSDRIAVKTAVRTAVVLGGSHTGMLAARALAGFADRVVVVERDILPEGAESRRGLPQARHGHILWSGGIRAIEDLLPGVTEALRDAGAHRLPVTTDMVALSPQGWFRRWPESHHVILAGRDLLDATIRREVLADERIELHAGTEAVGLTGTGREVTGVRVRAVEGRASEVQRRTSERQERILKAELVVDATGRGSSASRWLAALGLPSSQVREVDCGLTYASRLYLRPEEARDDFPIVNVQADPHAAGPGRAGLLMPIENGRWIATLSGTRGGEPSADNDDFIRFAREKLPHPVIGDLLANAEPLTDVSLTRSTRNRRHYYERMPSWPENFAVVGDALAAFNPVYGQGLAVAAQSVRRLREVIGRHGWGTPGLSRRIQKAAARPVRGAWDMAIGQDVFYPGATMSGPTARDRLLAAYVDRLMRTATGNGRIARRVTDVTSLERGSTVLLRPSVLLAAALGPRRPPLTEPPLTAAERKAGGLS